MHQALWFLPAFLFLACTDTPVRAPVGEPLHAYAILTDSFGALNGQTIHAYTLRNAAGMSVTVLDYGGIVQQLTTPDRNGRPGDVVLGYDALDPYLPHDNFPYFGCIAGRYANRIARARFTVDSVTYKLSANDRGNTLHGGLTGLDKRVWRASTHMSDAGASLTLHYHSPDGEEGFPGNVTLKIVYTLTADNTLRLDYEAESDKPTPLNLTHHGYFNLSAGEQPDILRHELQLYADSYTAVDAHLIPTGELVEVKDGPFDFTQPKTIGRDMRKVPGGYDHNFVVRNWKDDQVIRPVATLIDTVSGRRMDVHSTEPGVQFYSGNFLDGSRKGKNNTVYVRHAGLCLETQHFPDAPNQPHFPNTILRPGVKYRSTTIYQFSTIP